LEPGDAEAGAAGALREPRGGARARDRGRAGAANVMKRRKRDAVRVRMLYSAARSWGRKEGINTASWRAALLYAGAGWNRLKSAASQRSMPGLAAACGFAPASGRRLAPSTARVGPLVRSTIP
jgi:hypothetical protein